MDFKKDLREGGEEENPIGERLGTRQFDCTRYLFDRLQHNLRYTWWLLSSANGSQNLNCTNCMITQFNIVFQSPRTGTAFALWSKRNRENWLGLVGFWKAWGNDGTVTYFANLRHVSSSVSPSWNGFVLKEETMQWSSFLDWCNGWCCFWLLYWLGGRFHQLTKALASLKISQKLPENLVNGRKVHRLCYEWLYLELEFKFVWMGNWVYEVEVGKGHRCTALNCSV